jgi:diguanylate cyclase (GGDEF)-like protein
LSLLLLAPDHFERVNGTYSHEAGDSELRELPQAIRTDLRVRDVLACYGGDESSILSRGITLQDAAQPPSVDTTPAPGDYWRLGVGR